MMILIACIFLLAATVAQAATYHVTTTADNGDNQNPTPGSLRKAIKDANGNSGPDLIDFQIPGAGVKTISPPTPLPIITDPVTIDGYTQPGASANTLATGNNAVLLIELDGSNVSVNDIYDNIGLQLFGPTNGGTTIRGLVINRFGFYGIQILPDDAGGNKIEGCFIGTDPTGNIARPNVNTGILILASDNNTIGGTTPAARNLISGNADPSTGNGYGIYISGNGNKQAVNNRVQGNYIGTNAAGTAKVGNFAGGVVVSLAPNTLVGGTTPSARNVISGNAYGVSLQGTGSTLVQGNYIGTDVTGTVALGNSSAGVAFDSAADNTIGGTAPGARNLISGNTQVYGILFSGDSSTGNVVQGNYIGTNVTGDAALGNGYGIYFINQSPSNNKIGGTSAGEGNLISGNSSDGITMNASSPANNTIQGNLIGTNATGTAAVPNANGISIYLNSGGNLIGGSTSGARNVISGNNGKGIVLYGSKNQLVQGNLIGTDANGSALGNGRMGIFIQNDAQNNTIGGTAAGAGNIIAFNKEGGVVLASANDTGNRINGNAIYSNVGLSGGLGIDLFWNNVTQNDVNDTTPGPNNLQNFPALTSVNSSNGSTTIAGTLNSTANKQFRIEFFASAQCNPSGFGEGQVFLGAADIATVGNNANINVTLPVAVQQGAVITATATDPAGNTSEFSQCFTLGGAPPQPGTLQFSIASYDVSESGGQATVVVTRAGGSSGAVSVQYATSSNGASATPGTDYTAVSGTLNWASGDLISKTFSIPVSNDPTDENDETVNLVLSNPTGGATLGNQSTAVLIIKDDDAPVVQPTIQFGQAAYSVAEGAGHISITVTRTGDTSTTASVFFNTADASAVQKNDFNIALGRLKFAPGEAAKSFDIFITNDAYVEGPESFSIILSEPESINLGATTTTVVTINDNDLAPSANNPADDADFFIRQHYVDFLNREPEPQGLQDWKAILANCAAGDTKCDRIEVSSGFFRSPEFYDRGYFVYRFYETALGRKPDYMEFMPGLRKVTGFLTPQQLEAAKVEFITEFMDTAEYKQRYAAIQDAGQYVDTLAQTAGIVLSNRDALVQSLQANQKTRAQVLREVIESAEVGAKFYNKAFVVMQYFGYLRRDPDALYLNWIDTLNQTGDYRVMVNGFINSPEYRARFNQ
jgi:hypothetical protein